MKSNFIKYFSKLHIYTYSLHQIYYSTIKKNKIMLFAATWIDPESVILNEVSQTEKYHTASFKCGI